MRIMPAIRATVAFVALALAISVTLQPTTPVHAAVIPNAVTDVKITQSSVANGASSLSVRVDFSVGAGIGQGGTVRAGDTFWVDFDEQVKPLPGTFPVYGQGTNQVVANITVAPSPLNAKQMRATFELTSYVETRTSTTGWAQWNINFANTQTPPGEKRFSSLPAKLSTRPR